MHVHHHHITVYCTVLRSLEMCSCIRISIRESLLSVRACLFYNFIILLLSHPISDFHCGLVGVHDLCGNISVCANAIMSTQVHLYILTYSLHQLIYSFQYRMLTLIYVYHVYQACYPVSSNVCVSVCLSVCPLQSIRILLDHGADPTIKDKEGFTPAELARECGHLQAAAFLVKYWPPQRSKVHGAMHSAT